MFRAMVPLLAAVLLSSPALRATDDEPKAIIEKAIKAHGGADKIEKFKGLRAKSKGKLTLPVVGETEFTQEVAMMQPDKLRESLDLSINGKNVSIVTLVNGSDVSIEANGMAVPITDAIKDVMKDVQYMMGVGRLVNTIKDKSYEFSALGEVKVEDKPAIGVRVSSKGHKDINLFFDKKTGLLAKLEHRSKDLNTGDEFTEERYILEYVKDDEGMQRPKRVLVKRDGKNYLEADIIESKFLESIDDAEFKVKK